jgi:tRNA threonylcarbamoyladenosine biosynthesis protein TsaB
VILVIDTSSSLAALALIGDGRHDEFVVSARSQEVIPLLRRITAENEITRVAVATGPGSFTGLRVGVSFGLGLAMGRKIPIVPLPSLGLQAARGKEPVIAVEEAGRGRFYYQAPGADPALGEPADIPRTPRIVGRLSPAGQAALLRAGHDVVADLGLRPFHEAARRLLETAREVPYGSLKLDYMQSFTARI